MSKYLIAQIDIADRDGYSKYEAGFMDIFAKYNGKLLSVDEQPKLIEGSWPYTRTVLIEFPDEQSAMDWYQSDEYQSLAKHRLASSDGNLIIINSLE